MTDAAQIENRIAVHLQWVSDCMNDDAPDSVPSILRALKKRAPSKPWPCYQPTIDAYEEFGRLFAALEGCARTLDGVAACLQGFAVCRLAALAAALPVGRDMERLRGKRYVRDAERRTGCSYLTLLTLPSAYARMCDDFCERALRLLPAGEGALRLGVAEARAHFAPARAPGDREAQANAHEFRRQLERLQRGAVPGLPRPIGEMLLLGCYAGRLAHGALDDDDQRWADARLFLFSDAIVVHRQDTAAVRALRAADAWVVDASALLGAAKPIAEVLGTEESFAFRFADAQELTLFAQKWQIVAGDRAPDFGAFSPVALGPVDAFEWERAPGIDRAQ
jgi:hypothetical protein